VKFKLADKGMNLERLGRYLKLFTQDANLNVTGVPSLPPNIIVKFLDHGNLKATDADRASEADSARNPVMGSGG